jgi:hypothetical protein
MGLHGSVIGVRSCNRHEFCGRLAILATLSNIIGYHGGFSGTRIKAAIRVVLINEDGAEKCHVRFLPRHISF